MLMSQADTNNALIELTSREQDILGLLSKGMSDRQIADEFVFTVGTVKWYNRQIYSKLGVRNRTEAVTKAQAMGYLDGLPNNLSKAQQPDSLHNLPAQLTPFIGRKRELAEIVDLLETSTCRLLTLTGPGGIGKTRLALEAGRTIEDDVTFANGVYFVPLQPVSMPDFIVPAIADALQFPFYGEQDPKTQLLRYLGDKCFLLLLDNFEHLLEGADLLPELLDHAPGVKLLLTSRERLHLSEEWVLDICGLPFPSNQAEISLDNNASIQLFAHSARRAGYVPQAADMTAMVRICQLVEGNPLAIELSAAWSRVMSCAQITDEIVHSLDILTTTLRNTPEKHRSMRAVFEHSWSLLSEEEQRVFRKLSVFRSGFRREAAELVAGASLLTLSTLVDKSLLRIDGDGRYDVQELLRQFSHEHLETAGEMQSTIAAHSVYFLQFVTQREADIKGRRQREAFDEIEADFENVRLAWGLAVEQQNYQSLERVLESMLWFGFMCANHQRVEVLFERLGTQLIPQPDGNPHPLWVRLSPRLEWLRRLRLGYVVNRELSHARLMTCLEIVRACGDQAEIAATLFTLGWLAVRSGDTDPLPLFEESLSIFTALNDTFYQAWLRFSLGIAFYELGDLDSAIQRFRQCLDLSRGSGDAVGIGYVLFNLADVQLDSGNYAEAEGYLHEVLHFSQESRNLPIMVFSHCYLARILGLKGDLVEARKLAQTGLKLSVDHNDRRGQSEAYSTLGWIACIEGDYIEGKRLCEQSREANAHHSASFWANQGLALAACGLGHYDVADQYLQLALAQTAKQYFGQALWCLPVAALIRAARGETEAALEALALAFTCPAYATRWMESCLLITRLRANLEAELGQNVFETVWQQGLSLEVDRVVAELLHRQVERKTETLSIANRSLPDMLTERELEILGLVADEGLNNAEIAGRLFLSVSTVQWYLKQIYSKLNVHNRTKAILRARELNLLT
jgi:DNA-binding NarL/FixJ family response regulator/predicted ATPase